MGSIPVPFPSCFSSKGEKTNTWSFLTSYPFSGASLLLVWQLKTFCLQTPSKTEQNPKTKKPKNMPRTVKGAMKGKHKIRKAMLGSASHEKVIKHVDSWS